MALSCTRGGTGWTSRRISSWKVLLNIGTSFSSSGRGIMPGKVQEMTENYTQCHGLVNRAVISQRLDTMILEVFSNLYNSVILSYFTFFFCIIVLNNERYNIANLPNEKSLQSSCSSIHSLKGGSIENFENLCSKMKVLQQCVFTPYCKDMNVVTSTENCAISICTFMLFTGCFLLMTLYQQK